jgi:ABC-type Fe3+ transport system permease subunit
MKLINNLIPLLCFVILIFFILPVIYIMYQIFDAEALNLSQFYLDIFYVLIQSILSATFSVGVGLLIALSYLKKGPHWLKTLYWGLLPQALPTVLIVYTYFKIFSIFGFYPQSYIHVVVVHVFINMGLVTFLIFPHLQDQIEKKVHLMVSLQLPLYRFFKMIIIGELASTVFYIWILIFSFSMTSFSVPLLLSGDIPSSFDYLIYIKGYIEGDWSSASILGFIEFVFLGALFFVKGQKLTLSSRNTNFVILNDKRAFFFLLNFLPLIFIFLSLLYFGESSFGEALLSLNKDIYEILINTVFLSAWTLLFYSFLFWSQIYILKYEFVRRFHQFFWPLSPILLSFVILSFSLYFSNSLALKVCFSGLAIATFIFPIVFKFWILPEYANLNYFYSKSEILGLSYPRVFSEVIVPYFKPAFKTSLAYVGLFAIGDFTLSGILISDLKTIGLSMRTYIQTYQLIEAQLLAMILIFISLVLIYFFGGHKNEHH